MERADEIFFSARTNLGNANPIEPLNDTAIKPTGDEANSETIASWGIRLNSSSRFHSSRNAHIPPLEILELSHLVSM